MGTGEPSVPVRGNLRARLTRLFGREPEIAQLSAMVGRARLLTLVGAPGCGKTRLAVELGARAAGRWPGGVWFVDLASVADGASAASAMAATLGLREQPGRPVEQTLVEALSGAVDPLLVVLDNCEHLVDAVAGLAGQLVVTCASVQVLATSRVALGLSGEQVWDVPPLPVEPAVELFVDRASLASSRFRREGPDDDAAIEAICDRLAGLPLAIELAAASTRLLSVGQILDRLAQALPLVGGGRRGESPRHETMAATVDWSLRLVSPAEQRLFARLSVFVGGFDLEAAEAVAASDDVDVLEGLTTLVDHSLVVAEPAAGGVMRYRLLEPVRQSVAGGLAAGGEAEAVRLRHAEHYLALANRFDPLGTRGSWPGLPLLRIEQEEGNLLAALQWARDQRSDLALRLCDALAPFWEFGGRINDGLACLEEMLAVDAGDGIPDPHVRITALGGASRLAWRQRDYRRAREMLEERLALASRLGDMRGRAASHCTLGMVEFADGAFDLAVEHCHESIAVARSAGDEIVAIWAHVPLGWTLYLQGDVPAGIEILGEALAANRSIGNASVTAHACLGLAFGAMLGGDAKAHRAHLVDAMAAMDEGGAVETSEWLGSAISLARSEGRSWAAERLVGGAEAFGRRRGSEFPDRVLVPIMARAERDRWGVGPALTDRLMAEGARMTWDELVAEALAEPNGNGDGDGDGGHPLTPREVDVAQLVAEGRTNVEIAERLSISRRTVESHVEHILRKLTLANRQQIAVWAMRELPNT